MGKPADPMALMRMLGEPDKSYPSERARFDDWLMSQPPVEGRTVAPYVPPPPPEPLPRIIAIEQRAQTAYPTSEAPAGPDADIEARLAGGRDVAAPSQGGAPIPGMPKPGPPKRGGGGLQLAGMDVEQGVPGLEGAIQTMQAGRSYQIEAAKERASGEMARSEEESRAYGDTEAAIRENDMRVDAQRRELASQAQSAKAQLDAETEKAKQEVPDPDRWYSSRTAGQKIALRAAVFLGGFLEGFTRGQIQNSATRMIDAEINKDLELQIRQMQEGKEQRKESRNMLDVLYRRLGDMDDARLTFRKMAWEDFGSRMKAVAAKTAAPEIRARYLDAASAAMMGAAKDDAALREKAASKVKKSYALPATQKEGGAGGTGELPGKLDGPDKTRLDGYSSFIAEFPAYWESLKKEGGDYGAGLANRAAAILPGTDESIVEANRGNVAQALVRAKSGAQATDAERAVQMRRIAGLIHGEDQRRKLSSSLIDQQMKQAMNQASDRAKAGNQLAAQAFIDKYRQLQQLKASLVPGSK